MKKIVTNFHHHHPRLHPLTPDHLNFEFTVAVFYFPGAQNRSGLVQFIRHQSAVIITRRYVYSNSDIIVYRKSSYIILYIVYHYISYHFISYSISLCHISPYYLYHVIIIQHRIISHLVSFHNVPLSYPLITDNGYLL